MREILRRARMARHGGPVETRDRAEGLFVNRLNEVEELRRAVAEGLTPPPPILIRGQVGMGKTWLLRRAQELLGGPIAAPLISIPAQVTRLDFLRSCLSALDVAGVDLPSANAVVASYDRALEKVERSYGAVIGVAERVARAREAPQQMRSTHLPSADVREELLLTMRVALGAADLDIYLHPEDHVARALEADFLTGIPRKPRVVFVDAPTAIVSESWMAQTLGLLAKHFCLVLSVDGAGVLSILPTAQGMAIGPFDEPTSLEALNRYAIYLTGKPIGVERARVIFQQAGGVPLALVWGLYLALAEVTLPGVATAIPNGPELSRRRGLRVLSIAPRLRRELAATLCGRDELAATEAYPFVESLDDYLSLPGPIREVIEADFRQRDPEEHAETVAQAVKTCGQLLKDETEPVLTRQRLCDLLELYFVQSPKRAFALAREAITSALERADLPTCDAILAAFPPQPISEVAALWVQYWRAEILYRRGAWGDAATALTGVLSSAPPRSELAAAAGITLGMIAYRQGDPVAAESSLRRAADMLEDNTALRAYVTEQVAKTLRMQGRLRAATGKHAEAAELSAASGARYAHASALGSWGTTLILRGLLERGVAQLSRSIAESRQFGYTEFVCTGLRSRSQGHSLLGRYTSALSDAREAAAVALDLGDSYDAAVAKYSALEARRHFESGGNLGSESEAVTATLRRLGARYDLVNALICEGKVFAGFGDEEHAFRSIRDAYSISAGLHYAYGCALAACAETEVGLLFGRFSDAISAGRRAAGFASSIGARFVAVTARLAVADARADAAEFGLALPVRSTTPSEVERLALAAKAAGYFRLEALGWSRLALIQVSGADPEIVPETGVHALLAAADHSVIALAETSRRLRRLSLRDRRTIARRWKYGVGRKGTRGEDLEAELASELPQARFAGVRALLLGDD